VSWSDIVSRLLITTPKSRALSSTTIALTHDLSSALGHTLNISTVNAWHFWGNSKRKVWWKIWRVNSPQAGTYLLAAWIAVLIIKYCQTYEQRWERGSKAKVKAKQHKAKDLIFKATNYRKTQHLATIETIICDTPWKCRCYKGLYIAPYCAQPTSKALRYSNALSRDLSFTCTPMRLSATEWAIPAFARITILYMTFKKNRFNQGENQGLRTSRPRTWSQGYKVTRSQPSRPRSTTPHRCLWEKASCVCVVEAAYIINTPNFLAK